jgi:hypothetical protein
MSKGMDFYNEQLAFMQRGDVDGLLEAHYHDDAELVTFEFVLKGKEALKKYLAVDSPAQMGKVLGLSTVYFAESDDVIMYVAQAQSEKMGYFQARDAFYLKDGKIFRHIALTLPPDKDKKLKLGQEPSDS